MRKSFSVLLALILSGCAVQRAQEARQAQATMIGMPKEQVLACMGAPGNRTQEGSTEVWGYDSGNGYSEGSAVISGGSEFASGFGVSSRRFCRVNVVMTAGVVSRVNYNGPTGGLLSQGEQCAYATHNCLR